MNITDLKTPDQIELTVLLMLDEVTSRPVGLSEDTSVYTRAYIQENLAKISSIQELISDRMMQLSRIAVEIIKAEGANFTAMKSKERELKSSSDYAAQARDTKTLWLQNQLEIYREPFEKWNQVRRVVSEVKEAITERGQTVKRLDSALRLHSRLTESQFPDSPAGRGVPTPQSRGTSQTGELDIN